MTYLRILLAWALLLGSGAPSFANFAMSPSGTTTAFAIDASNQGTSLCAAASTECPAAVPINTAGAPLFTSGTPGVVNATLQASATTAIGKVDPNTIATWGLAPVGGTSSSPTNALAAGCQFNSSAPTFTTGNVGVAQCTAAGSLHTTVDNATTAISNNADGVAVQTGAANSPVNNYPYTFNGTTWDRVRSGSLIGSIRSTPTPSSASADALSHSSAASAAVTSLVAKASAGNLYAFNCTAVSGAAAGFCVAYNGSSAPSTGALTAANVLDYCFFGTTAAGCSLSRIPLSVNYGTGIVILVTSAATPYTYTTGTDTAAITADYD